MEIYSQKQYELGCKFLLSASGSASTENIIQHLSAAAKLDHPEAQAKLGEIYLHGIPGSLIPDEQKAIQYFTQAARVDPQAANTVGEIYFKDGPNQDLKKSGRILYPSH